MGFRVQMTAANDDSEMEQLNEVLAELAERFEMQRAPPTARLTRPPHPVLITAPLRRRDFRLLWTGMAVSLLGDGIFIVAVAWQAYAISDHPVRARLRGPGHFCPPGGAACSSGVRSRTACPGAPSCSGPMSCAPWPWRP